MKRNKEQEQQTEKLQTLVTNTVDINPTISMIWNDNDQNILIRRKRFLEWVQKWDPNIYCLQKAHIKYKE